jgi:hypothetical protein
LGWDPEHSRSSGSRSASRPCSSSMRPSCCSIGCSFRRGNFSFDPRTERLTQLFPDPFWSETLILIAIVSLVIAVALTVAARRLEKREA